MTQIIGFAGKKQSGKNTCCNYIIAMKLVELGIATKARLTNRGEIEVTDLFGEGKKEEWILFKEPYVKVDLLFSDHLGRYVNLYGFADPLKDMCMSILGLSRDQVYGTDKDKNTPTHILWEDVPTWKNSSLNLQRGPMTAREVLQYVGTDVFRKMYEDVWVDALIRNIQQDSPEVALICDVRFPNEIDAIHAAGGLVMGLTRDKYGNDDTHASEAEIQTCISMCDMVIDNRTLTLEEQTREVFKLLKHLPNVFPEMK